eukprot:TRINITY_DN34143_c0_g1_i1.p1 TRINITY_DN34143_c0_g1~~TRINITY_DN34143_c0_g1_i1.p1  ORF type:complete len:198 (+),score=24.30 TRINITY_DN34143_c0_g1_i1:3-596(+)
MMDVSRLSCQSSRSCKVWNLKQDIHRATSIPMYEQHLFLNTVKMRSSDALSTFLPADGDSHLKIGLLRSRVTEEIPRRLVNVAWQGFLAFSKDCGETIDGARLASLMRFADLHECASLFLAMFDVPATLTFPHSLAVIAELQRIRGELEDDPELDSDEDSDSDDEEVEDGDRTQQRRAERFGDLDWRGDTRLIAQRA